MTEEIAKALQAEWKVALYRNILKDPLVEKFIGLLNELSQTLPAPSRLLVSYYDFATGFIPVAAAMNSSYGEAWKDYLLKLILSDENLFSRQAEIICLDKIPQPIRQMAESDLQLLQSLAEISSEKIRSHLADRLGSNIIGDSLPDWEGLGREDWAPAPGTPDSLPVLGGDWGEGLEVLSSYYRKNGVGIFGRHHAFRWVKTKGAEGRLVGVKNLDRVRFNQLYEYEREQAKIIQNTEQFLAGYPANNVLLYGDRGTGKSSTVKALINHYGSRGLRLIEVQKQDLEDFPEIISLLAQRPQRFILYVDDLSFSQDEGQYRELKALLEGGLEAKPDNVLVYATSNRRHLIQESFNDKAITGYDPDNEDVRFMDTVQEKLSLADRFGITVTFAAPDQKRYLAIVARLAEERNLQIDPPELERLALKWELNNNTRSARTARQFIDYLEGQLGLGRGAAPSVPVSPL